MGDRSLAARWSLQSGRFLPSRICHLLSLQVIADIAQGYSWGCISAVHAPLPKDITLKSVVLISPALTPLKLLWWYQPLIRTITSYLQPEGRDGSKKGNRSSTKVTVIYGTRDDFTGVSTFRVFCDGLKALKGFQAGEISGAGHFWQSEEDGGEGEKLEETLRGCFQDEPVVEYS